MYSGLGLESKNTIRDRIYYCSASGLIKTSPVSRRPLERSENNRGCLSAVHKKISVLDLHLTSVS